MPNTANRRSYFEPIDDSAVCAGEGRKHFGQIVPRLFVREHVRHCRTLKDRQSSALSPGSGDRSHPSQPLASFLRRGSLAGLKCVHQQRVGYIAGATFDQHIRADRGRRGSEGGSSASINA
jgi:hypothetical protein